MQKLKKHLILKLKLKIIFKFIFSISQYRGLYPYMFRNSLITICSSLFIGIPVGLAFSYFMYKKAPLHKLFRITLFLPTIISSVVLTLVFRAFVEKFIPGLYGSPIGFLSKDAKTQFITLILYNIFFNPRIINFQRFSKMTCLML